MLQPESIETNRNLKTLFLGWQDKGLTRAWFPVGQLDVLDGPREYRFRYIQGAERARKEAGFEPQLRNQQYEWRDIPETISEQIIDY